MENEKQIEEMAKVIANIPTIDFPVGSRLQGRHIYTSTKIAEHLYNANYRKSSEVASEICSLFEDYLSHMTETTQTELKKAKEECFLGSIIACQSYQIILDGMKILIKGIRKKYVEGSNEG